MITISRKCLFSVVVFLVLFVFITPVNADSGILAFEKTEYTVNLGNGGLQKIPIAQNISGGLQYEWSSSNESIATVSPYGYVTPISGGTATISCVGTDANNQQYSASYVLTVIVPVRRITVEKTKIVLTTKPDYEPLEEDEVFYSFTPVVTIEPENATIKTITWTSSNTDVARVDDNGTIRAGWKPGSAVITGKPTDGSWATVQINVEVPKVFFTTKELKFIENEPLLFGYNIIVESGFTSIQVGTNSDCFTFSSVKREAKTDKKSNSFSIHDGMNWYMVYPKKAGRGSFVIVLNGQQYSVPVIVEHSAVIDEISYPAKQVASLISNCENNINIKTHFMCEVISIEEITNKDNEKVKLGRI